MRADGRSKGKTHGGGKRVRSLVVQNRQAEQALLRKVFRNMRALHLLPKSCPMRVWVKAGTMIFKSDGLKYMGAPKLVHAEPILAVLACQVVLIGAIEA